MSETHDRELLCLGLNHELAPVALRERLSVAEKELGGHCRSVTELPGFGGAVVLSTCNRMEIYTTAPTGGGDLLAAHLAKVHGFEAGQELPYYRHRSEAVAKHLFRVSSGLDSMVLGETEIFGQVKKAYAAAHRGGHTEKALNKLFQQAFQVAKHVRTNSQITRGATSVGAAGVDLAEKIFGELSRCVVMILGAGEMGQVVAKTLAARGVHGLIVSNRSYDKAVELAEEMDGRAMHLDEGVANLAVADIVITSTSAPHFLLGKERVAPALRKRRGKPLFLIDIAVPRDVEPDVGELSGVYLYDIDALSGIADEGRMRREQQIAFCDDMIERQMERLGIVTIGRSQERKSGGGQTGALGAT